MKKFPKKLFVTRENEGEGEGNEYLGIYEDSAEKAAELGKKRIVGEYELKRVVCVETNVTVSDKGTGGAST